MKSKTQTQVALVNARQELKDALERVKELRMKVSNLRLDAAAERALNKRLHDMLKSAREAVREEKRLARIAKMEKRLQDLRDKAARKAAKAVRKAGPVKVWSADEIAALNAANGAV